LRWIVGSSLRFRFLVVGAALALIFFGSQQVSNEKVDVFPEFAPTRVEVQTACLGLSSAEVEELVSVPLEDALNGVPGVDVIRSTSVAQLSSIELLFKRGTDYVKARQLVQERLQTVTSTLPTWAAPPFMMQPVSATSRILKVGLTSDSMSLMDLSLTAYWKIRARLLRVPGVANVAIWGERLKDMTVQVDPERMQRQRVSLDKVMATTSDALDTGLLQFTNGALIGTGGLIDNGKRSLPVQSVAPLSTPRDLAQVPLASRDGRNLRLGDVANVVYHAQPLIGDAVVDNGPGLMLVVEKFQGANTLDVTKGVDDALNELKPGLPGVQFHENIFRPAGFIETAIDNLSLAVLIGCALVVLVLVLFLYEWRAALISLLAIPLSLVAAALVLHLEGATINTMILAGFAVAVGVVVDDAIIDMENVVRRLRLRRAQGQRTSVGRVILEASLEVRGAILYATLINVVAVLPVVFITGLTGSFFRPLALAYALAVLASMVVALTITPALALILLGGKPPRRREPPVVKVLKRGYEAVLWPVVRAPGKTMLGVAAVAATGLAVLPALGQDLFPTFKERDFLMHYVTKPGTSIQEERRIVTRAGQTLTHVPGVRGFGSHIGQAFLGEEIVGPNFGENWISVDPKADYDKTLARIRAVADETPGTFRDVQTYLRERIDEVLAGSTAAVVVRIFGDDLHTLGAKADEVTSRLSKVKGLVDLNRELQEDVPQIEVEAKLPVAERYGLKPGDVRRAAGALLASEEVGDIYGNGKTYNVAVWSKPGVRQSLTDVRRLPIDTPRGGTVALGKVADVRITPTPSVIHREDASRRIDVETGIAPGYDLGSVTRDIEKALGKVKFPTGYHAELIGEAAERAAASRQLLRYAIGAAILVLLLLQVTFRSWRLAWLLFLTLPMALVGGLLAAYGGIGTISLGALIGFYTVLGIAARNGIMMVTHFQHLEEREGEPFGPGLVIRGAKERLSPILMTALATALALLPLVAFGTRPGAEIEHPMAVVILGGLATSTLLNLFVLPPLYLRFARRRDA
jgi:CzcA family heavy metal efflux pump